MLKAHLRLEGIQDGFDDEALAQHDLVSHGHQVVPHVPADTDTGRIVASVLTDKDADDGSQVGPLLDRIDGAVASVTGGDAYDRDDVCAEVAARHPAAAVVVPPRANAVPSKAVEIAAISASHGLAAGIGVRMARGAL